MKKLRQLLLIAILISAGAELMLGQPYPAATKTPIKHLLVIFQENNSFDHYFGKYPFATNPPGEPPFYPRPDTPSVNGLTPELRSFNPNGTQPFRLDRSYDLSCDNDNHYRDEQAAYDGGLMDNFIILSATGSGCTANLVMGYYDGNTVTALWNYAQHFAMSDNFFATTFGTTVMGHLNLLSGQTHGAVPASISGKVVNGSVIANVDPKLDDCSTGSVVTMSGTNIGDLLNAKGIAWGWFYGDWTATSTGNAQCSAIYNPHYAPFQYYASTANPHHRPPTSVAMIGHTDQANHQYSIDDLWNAVEQGNLPAVTFIKGSTTQTGHPGGPPTDSNPLLEQQFLVDTINRLERLPQWRHMAILITYDDSDGWYDHVMPPIVSKSNDPVNDALLGPVGLCGTPAPGAYNDRCGYGPRLPFLTISPFSKRNFVDNRLADQSSILRFIEDNWQTGQIGDQSFDAKAGSILNMFEFHGEHNKPLFLNPDSGQNLDPEGASLGR